MYGCNDISIDNYYSAKMQYACTYILIIDYKQLIDIWRKFEDTLYNSRTISNFLRIQGQKILFKDISRTSRTCCNLAWILQNWQDKTRSISQEVIYHGTLARTSSRYQVFEKLLWKLSEDASQRSSLNQMSLLKQQGHQTISVQFRQ